MKIQLAQIPDEIIIEYNLKNKAHSNGAVYIEIRKGMYGLPQASMLANKLLKHRLAKHGYYEVHHTPGYWQPMWRPIDFTLVVNNIGMGYKDNEHALHLLQTLCKYYEAISVNWTGTLYCGITLKWDYRQWTCEPLCPDMSNRLSTNFNTGAKVPIKPWMPLIHTKQPKTRDYP